MLRETIGFMRDLPRLHAISSVFIRHGLGDMVRRLGIVSVLEQAGQMLNFRAASESVRLEPAQRMRLALEELGPTFVKLGQLLSTRSDLLPDVLASLNSGLSKILGQPSQASGSIGGLRVRQRSFQAA